MMIVVSYDVSTVDSSGRRRLRKIAKQCVNFGQRVQNSVFECVLNPEQWARLRLRLLDIAEPEEDSLRFYFMGSNWKGHVEHHGTKKARDFDDSLLA
jgi:CRISPR-associated protein Cas2